VGKVTQLLVDTLIIYSVFNEALNTIQGIPNKPENINSGVCRGHSTARKMNTNIISGAGENRKYDFYRAVILEAPEIFHVLSLPV